MLVVSLVPLFAWLAVICAAESAAVLSPRRATGALLIAAGVRVALVAAGDSDRWWWAGLLIAVVLATLTAPLAKGAAVGVLGLVALPALTPLQAWPVAVGAAGVLAVRLVVAARAGQLLGAVAVSVTAPLAVVAGGGGVAQAAEMLVGLAGAPSGPRVRVSAWLLAGAALGVVALFVS